jgi:hydrogenase/urease accessory protein HupE
MVRSRGRDLNGWGVSGTGDIQHISLGNNSGAPFRNTLCRVPVSLLATMLYGCFHGLDYVELLWSELCVCLCLLLVLLLLQIRTQPLLGCCLAAATAAASAIFMRLCTNSATP